MHRQQPKQEWISCPSTCLTRCLPIPMRTSSPNLNGSDASNALNDAGTRANTMEMLYLLLGNNCLSMYQARAVSAAEDSDKELLARRTLRAAWPARGWSRAYCKKYRRLADDSHHGRG